MKNLLNILLLVAITALTVPQVSASVITPLNQESVNPPAENRLTLSYSSLQVWSGDSEATLQLLSKKTGTYSLNAYILKDKSISMIIEGPGLTLVFDNITMYKEFATNTHFYCIDRSTGEDVDLFLYGNGDLAALYNDLSFELYK